MLIYLEENGFNDVTEDDLKIIKEEISTMIELDQALEQSDCIVLMNDDDSYTHIPQILSKIRTNKKIIIDPWRMFKYTDFDKINKYITPGKCD